MTTIWIVVTGQFTVLEIYESTHLAKNIAGSIYRSHTLSPTLPACKKNGSFNIPVTVQPTKICWTDFFLCSTKTVSHDIEYCKPQSIITDLD